MHNVEHTGIKVRDYLFVSLWPPLFSQTTHHVDLHLSPDTGSFYLSFLWTYKLIFQSLYVEHTANCTCFLMCMHTAASAFYSTQSFLPLVIAPSMWMYVYYFVCSMGVCSACIFKHICKCVSTYLPVSVIHVCMCYACVPAISFFAAFCSVFISIFFFFLCSHFLSISS